MVHKCIKSNLKMLLRIGKGRFQVSGGHRRDVRVHWQANGRIAHHPVLLGRGEKLGSFRGTSSPVPGSAVAWRVGAGVSSSSNGVTGRMIGTTTGGSFTRSTAVSAGCSFIGRLVRLLFRDLGDCGRFIAGREEPATLLPIIVALVGLMDRMTGLLDLTISLMSSARKKLGFASHGVLVVIELAESGSCLSLRSIIPMISKPSKFSKSLRGDDKDSFRNGFCDLTEGGRDMGWAFEGVPDLADGGRGMAWLLAGVPDLGAGGRGMTGAAGSEVPGDPAGEWVEACELLRLSVATLDLSLDKISSVLGG